MKPSSICQQSSLALDFARVKNIRIQPTNDQQYDLVFELNARFEYTQHPATGEWEKEILYEQIKMVYDSFEMADAYLKDWVDSWQEFQLNR